MTNDYMTVEETAKYLKRTKRCVTGLCAKGKLKGAMKFGARVWMIPKKSVLEFVPSPQGFAVTRPRKKAQKQAEKASWLAEINAARKYYAAQKSVTI